MKLSYKKKKDPLQSRLKEGTSPKLKWDNMPKKKRKVLKDYRDKGYKPSSGRGVGM